MKTIYINKDQKLSDLGKYLFPHIPSNHIIFKNLTGIGATTMEINDKSRHSIIIEPNVPVIMGKEKKHPEVLGVYRGVSEKHINEYLLNDNIPCKKILTTPESFEKIFLASIEFNSPFNFYNDFFLLFDECDRISKDIDYRETIADPLFRFFKFKNKAFISATAVEPSDPLFKEQGFEYLSIHPTYEITKKLNLFVTNNPYSLLEQLLKTYPSEQNFIFFNSVKGIEKVISKLKISKESAVFCSDKSLDDVKDRVGFASSMIEEEQFLKYNFLTSRFFSAVDIDTDYDCNIFLISDTDVAEHSTIDPSSEAIQIIGRFRNPSIKKKIFAITNVDENLNCRSIDDSETYVKTHECIYDTIKSYRDGSTRHSEKEAFAVALDTLPFNRFLDGNRQKSYFKIDNYLLKNEELLKYKSLDNVKNAYIEYSIIETDIKYFDVIDEVRNYFYDSASVIHRKIFRSYRDNLKRIINLLDGYNHYEEGTHEYYNLEIQTNEAKLYFSEIFQAIGLELIEELTKCYSKTEVIKLIKEKLISDSQECMPFIEDIRNTFPVNTVWKGQEMRDAFGKLIKKYHLLMSKTNGNLERYLEISDRFKGRGEERNTSFYKILDHK